MNETTLVAEEGASLSSGSLRLYYLLPSPIGEGLGVRSVPVGCIDLYNYDPLNHRCAVGIMVATEHRRQGHALAMLKKLQEMFSVQCEKKWVVDSGQCVAQGQMLPTTHYPLPTQSPTEHCTLNTGLHTLYADIAASNTASLALFTKAGYTQCGHFKDWLCVDDKKVDSGQCEKKWVVDSGQCVAQGQMLPTTHYPLPTQSPTTHCPLPTTHYTDSIRMQLILNC